MLSCAAPALSAHARAPLPWPPAQLLRAPPPTHSTPPPSVKEEPMEVSELEGGGGGGGGGFLREHGSGFLSEGFHSASPSSSSKDSPGPSPRGSPLYYDAAAELGLQLDFRGALPYSLLTPPGYEAARDADAERRRYSPAAHTSTPLAAPPPPHPHAQTQQPARTPPESPSSPDFRDSGFHSRVKCEADGGGGGGGGSGSGEDDDEEPGLRVPAVNSHGKVKTFKCKQCEFVAVTKLSFWEHTKEHIKPEKMLTCPKCPFVTEYKHHLEYHMRNHFGSKPFRCSQCSYSCVNKSMLNSHLKSHSSVYQYRCADCNYATKYCHSLKLHLRKYRHNPAMVLNQDGTPNPLPIIDVYGTRRGPKQKPPGQHEESAPPAPLAQPPPPPPHPLFRNPFAVNFPYGSLLPHPFLFPPSGAYVEPPPAGERAVSPGSERAPPCAFPPRPPLSPAPRSPSPCTPPPRTPPPPADDALDLTSGKQSESGSPPPPATPTNSVKSRRKGRAFKLQPAALRLQHEGPRAPDADASGSESDASGGASASPARPSAAPAPPPPPPPAYECPYCDISFKDLTMHTIHMGYHGYNDPFMCNKCGERSADKVSFFIHLGRAEHA